MSLGMIQDVKTAKVCVQGSRHAWDSGMSIYAGMRRIYKERSKRQARQAGRLMCDWRRVCDQMARDQYLQANLDYDDEAHAEFWDYLDEYYETYDRLMAGGYAQGEEALMDDEMLDYMNDHGQQEYGPAMNKDRLKYYGNADVWDDLSMVAPY